mmetsp:Transcript_28785/g.44743  ORF Transcript_28785/g.44743 Transcript_28785/m.44743 type:complete len:321 (+) Transcript_28785:97-1059(+)
MISPYVSMHYTLYHHQSPPPTSRPALPKLIQYTPAAPNILLTARMISWRIICATAVFSRTVQSLQQSVLISSRRFGTKRIYHFIEKNQIRESLTTRHSHAYRNIEDKTRVWVKNVIVGLNFCPFAEKPIKEERMQILVVDGDRHSSFEIKEKILREMLQMKENPGTILIVAPDFYPDDFIGFLEFIATDLEDGIMKDYDLHGIIQIAPFHPRFMFDESKEDDVDNYTNRSPYPTFHLLKEEEVTRAVESIGGDSSKVWKRNVRFLRNLEKQLGRESVEAIIRGEEVLGAREIMRGENVSRSIDDDIFYERLGNNGVKKPD